MSRFTAEDKGFSSIEALLIVVIVFLIALAGVYVHHTTNTNDKTISTTSSKTVTDNTFAGWKTYSDSTVTFQYPASWTEAATSNASGNTFTLTAPVDSTIKLSDAHNQGITNPRLAALIIFPSGDNHARDCAGGGIGNTSCTIYDVLPVTFAHSIGATHVVISDFDGISTANQIIVTDDTVTVGAKVFESGVSLNGNLVFINAYVQYDTTAYKNNVDGSIANVKDFEATQSFKDLMNVFKSLDVKQFVNHASSN